MVQCRGNPIAPLKPAEPSGYSRFHARADSDAGAFEQIRRLTWDDVDFVQGELVLRHRKGQGCIEREHVIPMLPPVRRVLRQRSERRNGSPYVFPGRKPDKPLSYTSAMMKRACWAAGIPYKSYHATRRGTATMLHEDGEGLPEIQALLGHGDIATTRQYLNIDDDSKKAALDRLMRLCA